MIEMKLLIIEALNGENLPAITLSFFTNFEIVTKFDHFSLSSATLVPARRGLDFNPPVLLGAQQIENF